jgi:hypothetical protein
MEPVRGSATTRLYHAWAEAIDVKNKKLLLMPAYPPAFRQRDPLQESENAASRVPNARGGHSTMLARAPHRRAIESKEGEDTDKSMLGSHHSSLEGETWGSMEQGREYELGYDKLVIA